MKNKLFMFLMIFSLLLFIPSDMVEAAQNQLSQTSLTKLLNIISGDWYNDNGDKVLTIRNGYLNECKVVAGFDWAGSKGSGGAVLRITESDGSRDIRISWLKGIGAGNFVQLDKGEHLHNVAQGYFFESIGGIHLGMPIDAVESRYGKAQVIPPSTAFIDGNPNRTRWYYPSLGIILWLDGKSISHISLLRSSKLRLERSGLTCLNTPQEYARAYSMNRVPELPTKNNGGIAYSIGHGEFLCFGRDMSYVGLDIYGW